MPGMSAILEHVESDRVDRTRAPDPNHSDNSSAVRPISDKAPIFDDPLRVRPLEESAVSLFFDSLSTLREELDSPNTSEVMINRFDNIFVEQRGHLRRLDKTLDPRKLEGAIYALASSVDKSAKRGTASGVINAGHANLRIAAVMTPTAIDGHALSIRRFSDDKLKLSDYVANGAFSRAMARDDSQDLAIFRGDEEDAALADALGRLVRARKNILISGGTSTGKTTFLNSLGCEVPDDERVITIEDTKELQLELPNLVRLLSNEDKHVTPQLLVKLCLRFRPDRIVVGEVRGGEAYDFIQALSTGHDGGMGSIHSNDARGGLMRLETLAMLGIPPGSGWTLTYMRKVIADCFDYVIQLRRTGGKRHVSEIVEIKGYKDDDYILHRHF
ncbi:Pilus assembly protein, ATPase of CpaF family (plasmid) [Pararobbsia alpina]|uniref:CpaF family protein n=1 Tax=Pararobbsia alpina TaxID=621374 RepID=UPI0039A61CAA